MDRQQARLHIEGMSCGHCVARVRQALEALPGVDVLSLELGSATVSFDGAETTPAAIADAVTQDGYQATPQPS